MEKQQLLAEIEIEADDWERTPETVRSSVVKLVEIPPIKLYIGLAFSVQD